MPKPKNMAEEIAPEDRSSWSEDQKKREYYYDDAHGYETFDPDEDEANDETNDDKEN